MAHHKQAHAKRNHLYRASLSYGAGWAGLLDALCKRLQHHADQGGQAVQITQAKEKWGELSVNCMGGDAHAFGLIDMAEALSAHICELCGSPGSLQEGLCFEHAAVSTQISDNAWSSGIYSVLAEPQGCPPVSVGPGRS